MSTSLTNNLCKQILSGRYVTDEQLSIALDSEWTTEIAASLSFGREESIKYMPERVLTTEICNRVITKCPLLIQHIPNKFKTRELCTVAMKHSYTNIQWVPPELLTVEFLLDVFNSSRMIIMSSIVPHIPEETLTILLHFFINRCSNILPSLRIQPKEACLIYYRRSRTMFYQDIRSDENRRFVVRMAISDIVVALRASGLSTHLLVNMFEMMGPVLYPTLNLSGSPLSPLQLWTTVAAANHA